MELSRNTARRAASKAATAGVRLFRSGSESGFLKVEKPSPTSTCFGSFGGTTAPSGEPDLTRPLQFGKYFLDELGTG